MSASPALVIRQLEVAISTAVELWEAGEHEKLRALLARSPWRAALHRALLVAKGQAGAP